MNDALILIPLVAASYLAAHVAFEWLARRFRIVSGAEYLLLGILLGPEVSGLLGGRVMERFSPIITLGVGWTGALLGAQFVLPKLLRVPGVVYRVALVEAVLTLIVVTGAMVSLLAWWLYLDPAEALIPALALGAMATVTSDAGITVASAGRSPGDPMVRQLRVSAGMCAFVAVLTLGLLTALGHPAATGSAAGPTPTEWVVINVAIGVVGGILFHLFVGEERQPDRLLIALIGAIILVSGASAYLRLSAMLSTVVFGSILANTSLRRGEIDVSLSRIERPLYFTLLVLAGASWSPRPTTWVLPAVAFLLLRAASHVGSARLAARANGQITQVGRHWGRALLGQGGFALVLALSYVQLTDFPAPDIVFSAVVVSVLVTDLLSARFAASVFTTPPAPAEPS
jgi:Kef-type K+ transport system membrane component KefB